LDEIQLCKGDRQISLTTGGGGYGPPWRRDLDKVIWDLKNEYVSREAAEAMYGIVFAPDGAVDREATEGRRAELEAAGTQELRDVSFQESTINSQEVTR
jgi:N-methylhydantoinase B